MYPLIEIRKSHVFPQLLYFWTATIHNWLWLLEDNSMKDLIINDFKFYTQNGAIKIYAFVIMPNHIHLIFSDQKKISKEQAHVSILKHTAHQFQKHLRKTRPNFLEKFKVEFNNKKFQFWQRDSLAIEIDDHKMFEQKLEYIHQNPLQDHWNLVQHPCDYKYSSAAFWEREDEGYDFLSEI